MTLRIHGGCALQGVEHRLTVFECRLGEHSLLHLQQAMTRIIDAGSDKVRYYRLCRSDFARVTVLGRPQAEAADYHVV